jgi:hypothetical protein
MLRLQILLRRFLTASFSNGRGVSSGSGGNPMNQPSKLSLKERLKEFFQKYGKTGLMYYSLISTTSLVSIYTIVSSGVDIPHLISKITGKESKSGGWVHKAGGFAIAYAIHKSLLPIRLLLTAGVTRWAYRRGLRWEDLRDYIISYFKNKN